MHLLLKLFSFLYFCEMTTTEKAGAKYAVAIGFPTALIYTFLLPVILAQSFSLAFLSDNRELDLFFNPLIFAILIPLVYFLAYWKSGIKIGAFDKHETMLKTSLKFSLETNFKTYLLLIAIYAINCLIKGISITVRATLINTLLFPIKIFTAFFIASTIFTTLTTGLLIVKLVRNTKQLN